MARCRTCWGTAAGLGEEIKLTAATLGKSFTKSLTSVMEGCKK